jgi:hypothetical protein
MPLENPGPLATEGTVMRAHPVIAIATLILVGIGVGLGVKLTFSSAPVAAADVGSTKSVSIDVSAMQHATKSLPAENFHDMTFVFSSGGGG